MLFLTTQKPYLSTSLINIGGDTIPFSSNKIFFGVNIDNSLQWKSHIIYIITTISKRVGIHLDQRKELPKNILTLMYKTLFLELSIE